MNCLQEIEQEVLREMQELGRRRLEERLQSWIDKVGPVDPQSGLLLKKSRSRPIQLFTVSGTVKLKAWYGYSSMQKKWIYPCREIWNMEPYQRITPELQFRLSFTATQTNSYQSAARMAECWGTPVSDDLIRDQIQRKGNEAKKAHWPAPKSDTPEEEFSMVIMMDGWMARERAKDWGKEKKEKSDRRVAWLEIKNAVIYRLDQQTTTQSGRGMLLTKYTVARPPDTKPLEFGKAVQEEAMRRGLGRAKQVYVVMDGALWLWDLVEDRFSNAIKTLDFHHASQHLWVIGHSLYGEGSAEANQWVGGLLDQLKNGKEDRVIKCLEQLLEKGDWESASQQETLEREVNYFRKHSEHIHYQDRLQEGAPIGSGAVESLASQLQNRLKGCGKFWSRKGITNLLAILVTFKNQDHGHLWN